MTILDDIIQQKKKEVSQLVNREFSQTSSKKITTFKEKIATTNTLQVIAEIKRSSPSKGAIQMDVDPVQQAKTYEAQGAAAISVLTDRTFFNGSMEDLQAVREAVDLPILCKDFIIDPVQIDQAKAAGANIILLIVAALSESQLHALYQYARKLDLEVLCEVHNEVEMTTAIRLDADIIGINNRNLKTFEVDLATTSKLASIIPSGNTILVSESGIKTQNDAVFVRDAGADVILVGETLMRSTDLSKTFNQLQIPTCGKGVQENAR